MPYQYYRVGLAYFLYHVCIAAHWGMTVIPSTHGSIGGVLEQKKAGV